MDDRLEDISLKLQQKAGLKQLVFRQVCKAFRELLEQTKILVGELDAKMDAVDESVKVELIVVSDFEFHLLFSGDLLVFALNTNVVTFPKDHIFMKNDYVQEQGWRGYFGDIMVYNFMADSFKYNRQRDKGYLVARMLVNAENHFISEGSGPMNFLFRDLANSLIAPELMRIFIQTAMITTVDTDLYAPNFPSIQQMTVQQFFEKQISSSSNKIGFQMGEEMREAKLSGGL